MASLYADENFPSAVVVRLRTLGHDVLTAREAGHQGSSDMQILAFATALSRAVLTLNRRHFIRLHTQVASHKGILDCTNDEAVVLADRIHQAIAANPGLDNQLLRINRAP
jgi:hypothetical protein